MQLKKSTIVLVQEKATETTAITTVRIKDAVAEASSSPPSSVAIHPNKRHESVPVLTIMTARTIILIITTIITMVSDTTIAIPMTTVVSTDANTNVKVTIMANRAASKATRMASPQIS